MRSRAIMILISICILAATSHAQVGPGMTITPAVDGLLVTGPASSQVFQMRITGKDVGRLRTTKKYWFRADGVSFQFFSEEFSHFLITDMPKRPSDRLILKLYRSAYLHRNGNPKVNSHWITLANGQEALIWSYKKFAASPNPSVTIDREMFLVIVGPGNVFGLFAPIIAGHTEAETRRVLTRTLGTLIFTETE